MRSRSVAYWPWLPTLPDSRFPIPDSRLPTTIYLFPIPVKTKT
ncbi:MULTISPECIES: hypothetical protein [Moorena]|nr:MULTISPECIES: hypothetical protein [Moorena]